MHYFVGSGNVGFMPNLFPSAIDGAAVVLAIALIAAFAATDAQAEIVPLPQVSARTEQIGSKGGTRLVVRSLSVRRIHGRLTVSCNRCRRLVGRIRVSRSSRWSKRFLGVNWILRKGRGIRITIVRRGRIGRYLLLTAKRAGSTGRFDLVYKESGCLNRRGNHLLCPRGTPQPTPAQAVPSTPITLSPATPPQATPPPGTPPPATPAPVTPPPPASSLGSDQTLQGGQSLWSSTGYATTMQGDGNLVVIAPGNRAVWASGTAGS
jgi:hypothetical protein